MLYVGVEEEDAPEQGEDASEKEEQAQTLDVGQHNTVAEVDEIALWDSDDDAKHFVVSWTTDLQSVQWLVVFLQGRWTATCTKKIYTQELTKGFGRGVLTEGHDP